MPETKPKAPLTPEELRWRAAARTDVISRSDWLGALGIALSLVSILLGIVNNRRILVGKRPWGDL